MKTPDPRLPGKVALVTGAGQGIGRATALKLAAEGARLVVNDLDEGLAKDVAAEIANAGGKAVPCAGNITREDFPNRFVATALEAFGDIHVIVNNAGFIWNAPLHKITDEQWDAMQDVHLKAPFRILREAFPYMRDKANEEAAAGIRVSRKIVNVSSVTGTRGFPAQANYSAAKAGIIGLTKTLAKEWGRYGINVNCVAFGFIRTRLTQEIDGETSVEIEGKNYRVGLLRRNIDALREQVALNRFGTAEEAAGAILLFCLPESDYITGQVIEASGGLSA